MPLVRKLKTEDIPAALALSSGAGWNQTAQDWQTVIALAPETCLGIDSDGRLAATATLICYGKKLAWIGMVLTHPDCRRQGFATLLMQETLRLADQRGIGTVKLDATEMGQPLYESLGFEPEQPIQRWWREPAPASEPILDLDAEAYQANRSGMISATVDSAMGGSAKFASPTASLFTRPGRLARYLGPCLATNDKSASDLIGQALATFPATAWCWDLLPANRRAAELARVFGFAVTRNLVRMRRGKPLRGREEWIYAIAGFELG